MKSEVNAVEVRDLFFYYITPEKRPLFPNLKLPFKKIIFQKNIALNYVNLNIRRNRITALLGRNGSGKTSLIKLITGARLPHSGAIQVFGSNPQSMRSRLGLCLGGSLVYHRLTARENLEYFGRLYGVRNLTARIDDLASMLDLSPHMNQMVESFSFGMKMKLALARSMIHDPDFLILDEPTLGIDVEHAGQIRQFVRELKCTVLLTTHYMEEAEMLADDLCFIDKGHILGQGTKSEMLELYKVGNVADAFTQSISTPTLERKAS